MNFSDGVTSIEIPDDLNWIDEFDWSSVKHDVQPTIGGGMVISESVSTVGRPITLESGDNVWTEKSIIDILTTMMNTVDKTYTITLPDTRLFNVKFNRETGSPIKAVPVFRQRVKAADAPYTLTLKLMEV